MPLSGSESDARNAYHCRIELPEALPEPFAETVWWVKADMIATVGFARLDLFQTKRNHTGKRKYLTGLKVSEEQFDMIHNAIGHALMRTG